MSLLSKLNPLNWVKIAAINSVGGSLIRGAAKSISGAIIGILGTLGVIAPDVLERWGHDTEAVLVGLGLFAVAQGASFVAIKQAEKIMSLADEAREDLKEQAARASIFGLLGAILKWILGR